MKTLIKSALFLSILMIANELLAQGPPPPPANTPLDSGILILLGVTVGVGINKLRKNKQKNELEQ